MLVSSIRSSDQESHHRWELHCQQWWRWGHSTPPYLRCGDISTQLQVIRQSHCTYLLVIDGSHCNTSPANRLIPLFMPAVRSVYYLEHQQRQCSVAVSSGPESESVFQVDPRDHQLSHLYGLILWGETLIWTVHTCPTGRNSTLWLALVSSADRRERPIGCFYQMWSRVLQPVSERRSDIVTHLSHLQEETDPPPVSPPLCLTLLWGHCDVIRDVIVFLLLTPFFYQEHETFSRSWMVIDIRNIIDILLMCLSSFSWNVFLLFVWQEK